MVSKAIIFPERRKQSGISPTLHMRRALRSTTLEDVFLEHVGKAMVADDYGNSYSVMGKMG